MKKKNKKRMSTPLTMSSFYSCNSKRRYRSENEATRVADVQMLENMSLELEVYKCDSCRFWHLTKK